MSKRKRKNKRKTTSQPAPKPKVTDGDLLIQTAVQNMKTTH